MDGIHPARVTDPVIEEIRARERNGVIELPRRQLNAGDRVRILAGPFRGHLAIYRDVGARAGLGVAANLRIRGAG
jgi:transcription antitermination factor NusG